MNRHARFNCPIGPPPENLRLRYPEVNEKAFSRWRRYVDAIVVTPVKVFVIEAKVWHPRTGIADLLEYRSIIAQTPELQEYLHLPFVFMLVVPYFREEWKILAVEQGFAIEIYQPPWMTPHLQKRGLV